MDDGRIKIASHSNLASYYMKLELRDDTKLECNKALELVGEDNAALIAKLYYR